MQLVIGRVRGPHGVRGEVAVEVRTDEPRKRFVAGRTLATEPSAVGPLTVEGARWHGDGLLLRFAEARDRSAAERLRGTLLVVESSDLPQGEDSDEFHDHELIGLTVVAKGGRALGAVVDVVHLPSQDALLVRLYGGGEALVPFVAAIVPQVDRDGRQLVIDPPPGLIDIGESE